MYTVSIPVFIQHLGGLGAVLDKAAAWAGARKVNEVDLLNMRLSPDMFNLTRQVRAATDHAANAAGHLAGKELLKFANDETTIAQLKDRIGKTIDYLKGFKPGEIDGTEGKEISITFPSGQTRQFTGQNSCSATVCRIFGFIPPPPTTSCGCAASRSANATLWGRRRRDGRGSRESCRGQFFSRYPVLKNHHTMARHTARKTSVIVTLTSTLTSAMPKKLQRKPEIR